MQIGFHLAGMDASDTDRTHFRDVDLAIAVHLGRYLDIDASPGTQQQGVARADHVIAAHGNILYWREGRGHAAEEILAVARQLLARGRCDEYLEVARR